MCVVDYLAVMLWISAETIGDPIRDRRSQPSGPLSFEDLPSREHRATIREDLSTTTPILGRYSNPRDAMSALQESSRGRLGSASPNAVRLSLSARAAVDYMP